MRKSTLIAAALAGAAIVSSSAGFTQAVIVDPHHVVAPVPDPHPAIVDIHHVTEPDVIVDLHHSTVPETGLHDVDHRDAHPHHAPATPHPTHPPANPPHG